MATHVCDRFCTQGHTIENFLKETDLSSSQDVWDGEIAQDHDQNIFIEIAKESGSCHLPYTVESSS